MDVGIAMGAPTAVIVTVLTIVPFVTTVAVVTIVTTVAVVTIVIRVNILSIVAIVMPVAIVNPVIRVNIVNLAKDAMVVKSLKNFKIVVLCKKTDSKANQLYNKPSPFVGLLCREISNNTLTCG